MASPAASPSRPSTDLSGKPPAPPDLVWAKVGSFFQYWPGQIVSEELLRQLKLDPRFAQSARPNAKLVRFFGSYDFAWVTESNMTPFDDHYADRVKHVKSKRALRALEEAERFRETGHLPLAFAAVADSAVEESPEADEAPETPKRRGSGRQAPPSREEKRPKKEKGPSAQELAAKREQERRERRLRVMRHLALAPPPPPS